MAWRPTDMFHSMANTKALFDKLYDPYGDSYTEDLIDESIRELFESIQLADLDQKKSSSDYSSLREEMAQFENEYFPDESFKFGLFRLCTFYLDMFQRLQESGGGGGGGCADDRTASYAFDLISIKVKWRGGLVVDHIDARTTHCVIDKGLVIKKRSLF